MTLSLMLSAVIMALVGSGHCATMCGPLTLATRGRTVIPIRQQPSVHRSLLVHFGRIATYSALGAMMAAFSASLTNVLRNNVLHTAWLLLPNLVLLLSALWLLGFQQAHAPVERVGTLVWRSTARLRNASAQRHGAIGDVMQGALWGLAPCGMIYSALGLAVLAVHPLDGALVMAAFGVATLPVLLLIGALSETTLSRLQQPAVRKWLGGALLLLVLWNLWLLPGRLSGVRFSFLC